MTVYLDILFIENLVLNVIILYGVAVISKAKIMHLRIWLASSIGAIYVIIYYITNFKWYTNIIAKIMLAIVMNFIAFNIKNVKTLIKQILFFVLVSFIFGGAALAVIYIVNTNRITIQNGIIVGKYTLKTILFGAFIALVIICLSVKIIKRKITKNDLYCKIYIQIEEQQIELMAMLDTGNLLKEPITNIPVIVVEEKVLRNVLPSEILDNIENILGGDLENISEKIKNDYISRLKVIPFSSLGKQNGMLLGLKADKVIIEKEDEIKKIDKVIVGIYNKSLSKNGRYQALLGLELV